MLIKPSSVPQSGDNHLSRLPVARKLERRNPEGSAGSFIPSLFGLAPNGVYLANRLLNCWCALTAPFHPYRLKAGGSHFCGTFPEVTLAGRYPASFRLEPGLSSPHPRAGSDHPTVWSRHHNMIGPPYDGKIGLEMVNWVVFTAHKPGFCMISLKKY